MAPLKSVSGIALRFEGSHSIASCIRIIRYGDRLAVSFHGFPRPFFLRAPSPLVFILDCEYRCFLYTLPLLCEHIFPKTKTTATRTTWKAIPT